MHLAQFFSFLICLINLYGELIYCTMRFILLFPIDCTFMVKDSTAIFILLIFTEKKYFWMVLLNLGVIYNIFFSHGFYTCGVLCLCMHLCMLNLMHFWVGCAEILYSNVYIWFLFAADSNKIYNVSALSTAWSGLCTEYFGRSLHVLWWEGSGEVIVRVAPAFSLSVWVGFPPCWLTVIASIGTFVFAQTGS